jgi:hypothetical protein
MQEQADLKNMKQTRKEALNFSESNELGHERNQVAAAEKQAASQETAGLLDEQ